MKKCAKKKSAITESDSAFIYYAVERYSALAALFS